MTQSRCLLFAWLLTLGAPLLAAETRPNILFIYADDQPYKTMGSYPESPDWVKTPALDKLASRGVQFTRAYLGSWCMPSRAALLTGKLPHAIQSMTMAGEYPGSTYDPKQTPFWPAVFRKQGYQTAQIGKWHTGTDSGFGRDWDYQIVWNRPAHPENAGNYYVNQIMSFNGQERQVDGYSTDNYTQWAVDYIQGQHRDPEKPWYLWLCYGAVHGPTTPAERHKGVYAGKPVTIPADIYGPWPDKPAYLETTRAWVRGKDGKPAMATREQRKGNFDTDEPGKPFEAWVQQVNECALAIDEGVARVLSALEASGQLKNTLVVYTADQGYGVGEHGFSQKVAPYDATIASPLIISQPGTLPEGKHCQHPVNSPDLVTLFCNVAGIKLPWKTHGRDIRPLLKTPETIDWNSPTLLTHMGRSYGAETDVIPTDERLTNTGNVPWWALLRDGRYKYIRNLVEGEVEEIYDLESDPEELQNLALRAENRRLLESLRAKAIAELRRTDAKFVDAMPPSKAMLAAAGVPGKQPGKLVLPGEVLLDEKFAAATLPAGWNVNTGNLSVVEGVLVASQLASDEHIGAFRYRLPLQDCQVQLDFRFEGANVLHVGFDPAPGELKKKGHLFSVVITPQSINLTEHNDKADPASKNKVLATAPLSLKPGEWHTLLLESRGATVTASIDGQSKLEGKSEDFKVKKPGLVFRMGGADDQSVQLDNIKVWKLAN